MTTTRRDIISGVVAAAGATAFFFYAESMPVRQGQALAISPGFYPRLLAMILGLLSVIQIVTAAIKERATADGNGEATHAGVMFKDRRAFTLLATIVAALILYPIVLQLLGFALTSFLFLASTIVVLSLEQIRDGERVLLAVVTVGITLLTFLVFRFMLGIPFPPGIFR